MQRKLCTCWVFTRDDFAAKFIEDRPQQWGSGSCAVGGGAAGSRVVFLSSRVVD